MKPVQIFTAMLVVLVFLSSLSGCLPVTGHSQAIIANTVTESSLVQQSSEPATTDEPVAATTPLSAAVPTPIPSPSPTPKPTPRLSPKPTLTEPELKAETDAQAPDASKKVTLAEGFYYTRLDDETKVRITGMSYPADDANSAVKYDDLRYLKLLHFDFDGVVHEGELIVNKSLADEVLSIFYQLYQSQYPLSSVRLVDDFGEPGDDNVSMAANNTSAFNYRYVTGTKKLSLHSFGAAIDINPMLNPYLVGDRIAPENGAKYADRTQDFAGKIDHDDLCFKLFTAHGWTWGGDWHVDKDYQHFSKKLAA